MDLTVTTTRYLITVSGYMIVSDSLFLMNVGIQGLPYSAAPRCGDGAMVMTVSQMMVDKEFQKLPNGTAHNFICPKRNYLTAEQHPIIYRVRSLSLAH